ncbi:ferredoxin--NADP reductase [Candidatus Blochmanniella floridana]|uniref:Flavodoxin/ferredoxin--NADP reductase n=1 Tax=Blochmanniella floridana TaxID=203907 RepID=Q7VRL1_BLOFL|nr:ferredoxin--NADP reductase [Candidatus Blochmannia floridanus]
MSTWILGKVLNIRHWTNQLFSITINAKIDTFIAGQFSKIGIKINNKIIQRAYSHLNAPNNPNLEFYITKVTSGTLTNLLHTLQIGDTIMISKQSYGQFILDKIPNHSNYLWMIATGTGISPYLSILESFDKRLYLFLKIILIHATRYSKNLNYLPKMTELQKAYNGKLLIQTILSREYSFNSMYGYIPTLIENNTLEKKIGLYLNNNSYVMLCGNPQMITDTKKILKKKYNMKNHSHKNTGNIIQERYW